MYIKPLLPGIKSSLYKGMSHITGGGFTENIPRIFSSASNLGVKLDLTSYSLPAIWKWLMRAGNVEAKEMVRTFNCGVGMIIIVAKDKLDAALNSLKENGEEAWVIGEVQEKKGVEYIGLDQFGL